MEELSRRQKQRIKGYVYSEEYRKKLSISHKGQVPWNKGKKGIYSRETLDKMSRGRKGITHSPETIQKMIETRKDKKRTRWIFDRTKIKRGKRNFHDADYKAWHNSVKNRDGWKCKISNKDCCGKIEAHHILAWRDYPELRYDTNNGITLCRFHHPRKRLDEVRLSPYFQQLIS